MADKKENTKTLAQNKKARHEYFILETIEAGIELAGTEVKSARLGKVNLTDAYASIKNGEVFIKQMNISPFEQGNIFNRDPLRDRKLLLHKKEILKLTNQIQQDGYALKYLWQLQRVKNFTISVKILRRKTQNVILSGR